MVRSGAGCRITVMFYYFYNFSIVLNRSKKDISIHSPVDCDMLFRKGQTTSQRIELVELVRLIPWSMMCSQ